MFSWFSSKKPDTPQEGLTTPSPKNTSSRMSLFSPDSPPKGVIRDLREDAMFAGTLNPFRSKTHDPHPGFPSDLTHYKVSKTPRSRMQSPPGRTIILPCRGAHLRYLLPIYNHYVRQTVVSFRIQTQPLSYLEDTLNQVAALGLPFLTLTLGGELVGYAYASPHHWELEAYGNTVKIEMFLEPEVTGRGYGKRLLKALIGQLEARNSGDPADMDHRQIREVVAMVAMEQREHVGVGTRAAKFFEREGFRPVGVLKGVGKKFGRFVDVGIFQQSLVAAQPLGPFVE